MPCPKLVSGKDLADVLGITPARIVQLHGNGMPKHARGQYNLADCVQWNVARWQTMGGQDKSLDEQRKALLFEQTRKTHLENEETESKLFDGDEVEGAISAMMVLFVGQMEGLAPRVCNRLAGLSDASQIKTELHDECREILLTLSEAFDKVGKHLEGPGKPAKAPTAKGRKPVGKRGKNTSAGVTRAREVA